MLATAGPFRQTPPTLSTSATELWLTSRFGLLLAVTIACMRCHHTRLRYMQRTSTPSRHDSIVIVTGAGGINVTQGDVLIKAADVGYDTSGVGLEKLYIKFNSNTALQHKSNMCVA